MERTLMTTASVLLGRTAMEGVDLYITTQLYSDLPHSVQGMRLLLYIGTMLPTGNFLIY
jgi:hypothetical protein